MSILICVALLLSFSLSATQNVRITCGEPPDIQSASVEDISDEKYSVGTTVLYTCQFGYTARGKNRILRCEESDSGEGAEWTSPQFTCTPQTCGDPGYINNGRRIGSLFTFPSSVKYECDQGYKLVGLSARYCQTSGSWSGKLPSCEKMVCKPPQNPDNGHVTYSSLDYGSELKYKCDKGFHLNTDETVFCTSSGRWSNTNLECIESLCNIPLSPEHGSVQLSGTKESPRAGSIAIFSCDGDRTADGPTTSKCLETGDWTFPTPNCLEPCSIPYVADGIIGRYVEKGYRRRTVFEQNEVGTRVDENQPLYLRCSDGYEVSNSEKIEERIFCSRGKWSREIHCNPVPCRTEPPSVKNGQAVALSQEHGGSVLYLCDQDFKKVKNETVICDFGKWKGSLPICKRTSCLVQDLRFQGLVKGTKSIYKDGETFEIECESRYQVARTELPELRCEDGSWKGPLPPCVAASCTKPPPKIDLGRPDDFSTLHSSIVKYVCEDPYIPVGNSQVYCSFGEWEGLPPKCEDSRCYLAKLQRSMYVDTAETPFVTLSGNHINVVCKEGYSPRSDLPLCLNGKWTQNSNTPCKEKDCTIPFLLHGDVREEKLGDNYFNWSRLRFEREVFYKKIPPGTVVSYGSSLFLFCDTGYSFQGSREGRKGITCFKGRWEPHPVCLLIGMRYVPPTTTTQNLHEVTTSQRISPGRTQAIPAKTTVSSMIRTATTDTEPTFVDATEEVLPVDEKTSSFETERPEEDCYCEYPVDDTNLVAHADGKRLQYQAKVEDGSVVEFRCLHVGFHKLRGPQEIRCEECRNWHSSEFPTCGEPKRGSAIILFDNTLNVSTMGNLEANIGQKIKLMCVAMESRMYPHWNVPSDTGVTVTRERKVRESYGDVLYVSHLVIEKADVENEGAYGCAVGNNSITNVNLVIDDLNLRCPEFPDEDGISVRYDMGRRVRSRASFSCTKRNQELVGKAVLTCSRSGEWSDPSPQCADKKCRELRGNDLLSIYYTSDREIGSRATFHCFEPGKRSGVSFATCLEDGIWSDPTPTCRTPPCSLEKLFTVLPQNVVPDVDNVNKTFPFNTTVKLTCDEEMIVEGNPVARCGKTGEWEFQSIQCISGCPKILKPPDAKVIVKPEKDVYKLGEMITFSCPPGMSLNSQSQLIMCLKYGWSETTLPECQ